MALRGWREDWETLLRRNDEGVGLKDEHVACIQHALDESSRAELEVDVNTMLPAVRQLRERLPEEHAQRSIACRIADADESWWLHRAAELALRSIEPNSKHNKRDKEACLPRIAAVLPDSKWSPNRFADAMGGAMNVFDLYPLGGRVPMGRPRNTTGACRSGYGLALQRMTGQSTCAYCGADMIGDYHRWLLLSVDHVVPAAEARRLGIDPQLAEDAINLVLCCAGCNGFGNRYRCAEEPKPVWTLEEFLALRDHAFAKRSERIAARRATEIAFFDSAPWVVTATR